MGVPGLWDLLRPASSRTSLSVLSREAFHANRNGLRALTIGIDASIWIFHAQVTHYGENPFLRTIFFKITALLQQPVLPVFVFDGPNKPGQKRNQNVAGQFGTGDARSRQFKALLDMCGLEWWNAPGEAEAELAVMNRQGKIDAVLSDDVDALLFGATCLLRNNSPTLSGAQASTNAANSSRGDMRQYEIYRSSAIRDKWASEEGTKLLTEEDCRMAMVLVALLGGGDYTPEGLPSIGPTISSGLAKAGLSDFLRLYNIDRKAFDAGLPEVHQRMIDELRTNASKQVGRKYPDRANKLAAVSPTSFFPSFTLDAYLNPATSPLDDATQGWPGFGKGKAHERRGKARNEGRGDIEGMALACEKYFEWGTKEIVVKKFAGESVGLFGAEIMNEAREAIRARSPLTAPSQLVHQNVGTSQAASTSRITSFFQQSVSSPPPSYKSLQSSQTAAGTPPSHIIRINSIRDDPTIKGLHEELHEYRLTFQHGRYIQRCHSVMRGTRVDPTQLPAEEKERLGIVGRDADDAEPLASQSVAPTSAPKTEIRMWLAEWLVQEAWPELVRDWEEEKAAKQAAKLAKSPKKKKALSGPSIAKGKGKKLFEAKGEDINAFTAFFTQKPRPEISRTTTEETDEEVEKVENRSTPRRTPAVIDLSLSPSPSPRRSPSMPNLAGKKCRARPCPTSSLSSLPSDGRSSPSSSRAGSPTPRARPRAKAAKRTPSPQRSSSPTKNASAPKRAVSPKPTSSQNPTIARRFPRSTQRVFSKSKSSPSAFATFGAAKDQPIDLCSSDTDDQTPAKAPTRRQISRPITTSPPRGIFTLSSRPNTLSPPPSRSSSPPPIIAKVIKPAKTTRSKKAVAEAQNRLQLPTLSQSSFFSSQMSQDKVSPKKASPPRRKAKYVVVSSNEDEEVLDCTRSR
ncbi:hypothetical protein CI109_100204 [Kwoniella shandongensis]|uniref:Uncharacterized protein n=1 Tax=Kwoniella shandongensis TaxID=1734106 RepID=A0A5M6BY30_9TREE|nr:uncharacterized protein CI109_005803 [Kwoniella shandongensis]KAA5525919.1 hypothetical protein CI109_005803 [Kwoniella shandongensis]